MHCALTPHCVPWHLDRHSPSGPFLKPLLHLKKKMRSYQDGGSKDQNFAIFIMCSLKNVKVDALLNSGANLGELIDWETYGWGSFQFG